MEQKATIITLGVKSLEASVNFYENIIGWKRMEVSTGDIVFFQMNGFILSLYPYNKLAEDATIEANGNGFKGFTLAHNLNSEQEVNSLIENLRSKGVQIVKEPQKVFWGGYSSYFADPDNNLWEVAYNPFM